MDKNKPSAAVPSAPLTRMDDDGIQWGFDPSQQRWFAIVNGKKTSSQDFSKLSDKVSGLLAQAKAAVENKDNPREAPAIPAPKELVLIIDRLDRGFSPILAKVEWNAASGEYEILRYKEFKPDGKAAEGGWGSSGSHLLKVFHPECLTKEDRDYLTSLVTLRTINRAIKDMSERTWTAWRAHKQDQRVTYEQSFRNGKLELVTTDRFDVHSSRRQAHMSPNLPCLSLPTADLSGWETTPEGYYRRGEVSIRLGPSSSKFSAPRIQVWADRWPDPVYEGDFKMAATLANATVDVLAKNPSPVQEWHASEQVTDKKSPSSISWPSLWEQWGGAVFASSQSSETKVFGMILGQELPNPMRDQSTGLYSHSSEQKGIAWRERWHSSRPVFLSTGPEDQLLDQLDQAIKKVSEFLVGQGLCKGTTDSPTWWRNYRALTPTLPSTSPQKDVLQAVVGLHDDDPESMIKDPVQVVNRFNRELARMERQVMNEEHYTSLLEDLGQVPRADTSPTRNPRKP